MKKNYHKIIGFWTLVFIVGGVAGIFATQIFLPWLAGFSCFSKISWICQSRNGTTIVNRTEKIYLTEDTALTDNIAQIAKAVVGIKSQKTYKIIGKKQVPLVQPEILAEGSGFILTNDGLIVTTGLLVPEAATKILVMRETQEFEAQVIKRDKVNNLALLKTEQSNLPVVNLGEAADLKIGERVFLLGIETEILEKPTPFADLGFVRMLSPLLIQFNETQSISGTPLVNIKGEVLGMNVLNKNKEVEIVLSDKIRELIK